MKKAYSKPEILFESFALSTSIAANCQVKMDTHLGGTCGIVAGPDIVFADVAGTQCTLKIPEDQNWNGICYHVPVEGNNLFNS